MAFPGPSSPYHFVTYKPRVASSLLWEAWSQPTHFDNPEVETVIKVQSLKLSLQPLSLA